MEINKPVAAVIVLAVTLIFVFLFAVPKYKESGDLQASLVKKQAEYDGKSVYYLKVLALISDIEDRKDALEKINSALPSNFSFASLIYFLQKKADKAGLSIQSVTFSDILPASYGETSQVLSKEVKNITFTLYLSGNYRDLKNFLSSLERSARLFEVKTISFASLERLGGAEQFQNQSMMHEFKLEVKTYTY